MFYLYHHNDLLRLTELLSELLPHRREAGLLQPDTVIVPNRGVARWLQITLAEHEGIVANLEFPLPARFIWQMLPSCLPEESGSADFARSRMLWHIYAELPEVAQKSPAVASYLAAEPRELMRLQLAEQLADVFDQYLIYRPALLRAWEAGRETGETAAWQAPVWRALRARLRVADRSELLQRFIGRLSTADSRDDLPLPERVFCFGLDQMPPDYLRFFYALGQRVDVHFLMLNPSDSYWGDIGTQPRSLSDEPAIDGDALEQTIEAGHPLLASLGRGTRDLLRVLYSSELADIQEPELGETLDYAQPASDGLLGDVQRGLLQLSTKEAKRRTATDASLQIHACHSALREVQVLQDQLLDLLGRHPEIQPRDILVMTPDMARYAPVIRSVFGAATGAHFIPWSLADQSRSASHPIVQAFLRLLNLPLSRWEASEILPLAAVPATLRRFGLDAAALTTLITWTQSAGVRWGLDADTRKHFGAGDLAQNSWRFGMDRLLLGLAQDDADQLTAGVAPWTDLEGGATGALGALWYFLDRLAFWQDALQTPRTAGDWQDTLNQLLEDLFRPDADDSAEARAVDEIRSVIAQLEDAAACLKDATVDWIVVREILSRALAQTAANQPFLSAGVTFSGMEALRGVPFEIVCMIGMNDGVFPRQERNRRINLLRQSPRLGDFNRRDDDQLSFLQAINSARTALYISYTGQDVGTGESLPPATLVDEFADFLRAHHLEEAAGQTLVTQQPMQPFSPRYFQAKRPARVFSFAAAWTPETLTAATLRKAPLPLDDGSRLAATADTVIELTSLRHSLDHPPRQFLRGQLQIRLDVDTQEIEDEEPLSLSGLAAWQLRRTLLEQAQKHQVSQLDEQPDALWRARGDLPPPPLDHQAFADEAACVNELLPIWQAWTAAGDAPKPQDIELTLGERRIVGRIANLRSGGLREMRAGRLSMKFQLRALIDYLVWTAAGGDGDLELAGIARKKSAGEVSVTLEQRRFKTDRNSAQRWLQQLLELHDESQRRPLLYMPELGERYWQMRMDQDKSRADALAALNGWLTNDFSPAPVAADPYLQALLLSDDAPLGSDPENNSFCDIADGLNDCLAACLSPAAEDMPEDRT